MERRVALLRGINLGPHNRIAMADLRDGLAGAGFHDVRTYVQSGNVVLASAAAPDQLERDLERLIIDRWRLEVPVIVRTRDELHGVVERNPLGDVATNPKRYQVTFLAAELEPQRLLELRELATDSERVVAGGREVYAWHPDGVARSKLSTKLAGSALGVKATARNWTTVETLLAMASE
jgi:uncharacterized protein (DUF1697 family)